MMITNVMITKFIRILPSYPRFTLSSAFYPHIRVLLSHPRFTPSSAFYPLISAFYSHIRVLPCRPSVRPDIRPDIRPSIHPSVRIRVLPLPSVNVRPILN